MNIFKETNILNQEVEEKSILNLSNSILLHKPLASSMTITVKRSIAFGEQCAQ